MDLELVASLRDGVGAQLLDRLTQGPDRDPVRVSTTLRREGHPAELVAAVLTQARLRERAVAKFGDRAATLLFTPDGVEQATRPAIAVRHAARFAGAGVRQVWDLGCGVGSDAIALRAAGLEVVAVDRDPLTATIAAANLGLIPGSPGSTRVEVADVEQILAADSASGPDPADGLWFDPARRTPGVADIHGRTRRSSRLVDLAPSWDTVLRAAHRARATGAKLAPSFPHPRIPAGAQAQWVSFGGELLECVLWWGAVAQRPGRSAAIHTGSTGLWIDLHEDDLKADDVRGDAPTATSPVPAGRASTPDLRSGSWIYEADPAVTRSGLTALLEQAVGGVELDDLGYVLAADRRTEADGWARRYRIVEVLPYREKILRAWGRSVGLRRLTVKTRGIGVDIDRLRRRLEAGGDSDAVLLIIRARGRTDVLHLEPDSMP